MLGHKDLYSLRCVPILCLMALIIVMRVYRLLVVFRSARYGEQSVCVEVFGSHGVRFCTAGSTMMTKVLLEMSATPQGHS